MILSRLVINVATIVKPGSGLAGARKVMESSIG